MTKYIKIIVPIFAILVTACNKKEEITKSNDSAVAKHETIQLEKKELTTSIALPAELTSFKQVELFAKVSSYVKSLKVDIGSEVKQGQLLIELEAPEIQSQLAAAKSRVHSQQAIYTSSNSTYNRLLETSKVEGTISKNDLEVSMSRKNADFALLEAAKANLKELQVMQSYLLIKAPFNGKITARNVNIGAYVGSNSQTPLLTMLDENQLRLSVSIPEVYAGFFKIGDEIDFNIVSLKGENFKAKISRMSGALDAKFRSETAELDVVNTTKKLLPGMIAQVILPLKSKIETFIVPKSAVITTSEGIYVIKVMENGLSKRINVSTGLEVNGEIELFSNELQNNETVLKIASEEIIDGTKIK